MSERIYPGFVAASTDSGCFSSANLRRYRAQLSATHRTDVGVARFIWLG